MSHAADPHQPSSFGRGWIPADRDIGLPNDDLPPPHSGGHVDWAGWVDQQRGALTPPPLQRRGLAVAERSEAEHRTTRGGGSQQAPSSPASAVENARHHLQTPSSEEEGAFAPPITPLTAGHSFTPLRIARFLEHLSRSGNVRAAALAAGASQQTAHVRRRRDPAFAAGWEAALLHARAAAEQVLAERALMGTTETIWYRGEAVGQRQRFDARLLLAHLARLDARAARASPAIHRLAEEFDDMLLALGQGEAPAQAACLPDPERTRYIEECEAEALRDFHDENPEPDEDADDALWDLWGEVRDALMAQARTRAEQAWDAEGHARDARLEALFPAEEEVVVEARQPCSPAQAGASGGLREGHRKTPEVPACAGTQTPSAPCKPRKPLSHLKCGTAAPALLASTLNWPLHQSPQAPHLPQATPLRLPPVPWPACPGVVTGRPC
ncbi:MAG: hypothetical protein NTX28_02150 [Novosphingobium sp.]|nr:hypothetical protein [Novosphingobium sp.]